MPNKKSIVPTEILDRIENRGWDQSIAEAKLAISQLYKSVAFFELKKSEKAPYPRLPNASTQI
jgi:hypothetical protein